MVGRCIVTLVYGINAPRYDTRYGVDDESEGCGEMDVKIIIIIAHNNFLNTHVRMYKFWASSSADPPTSNITGGSLYTSGTGTSTSSRTSLSSLRQSLPENPHIYDYSELCSATINFLARTYTSTSSTRSWRCTLRGKDAIIFQRKFRRKIQMHQLKQRLAVICRSHHLSLVKLLGASISGDHIFLVYDFVDGANLATCLRNPRNPNFSVLSAWMSRMKIATDLAHGLDYIHNSTGLNMSLVHNHIKSSSILVTEPSFNAKICHFGNAQLCGEIDENGAPEDSATGGSSPRYKGEIQEVSETTPSKLRRSDSRKLQFEGVKGYMSPEFQSTGVATQKSDVYAFGVVILELLSGEEPFKYKYDKAKGDLVRTTVIEAARAAIDGDGDDGGLRRWVDRKLKDSFPVEVAGKLTRLALDCVHVEPDMRPNMGRVAGKISKLYLESSTWSDSVTMPTDISVSLAPR
ncbi:lysM domain receptor-like kinase 3 [Corylus avellana]|uniref:lysM domain receptor-like kinase 3 n=1 Tax=Corylus avellana TaxID=13451 RepID=UPI001E2047AF|nr:lysM domain receptor-like kinase 3 [Corylus avellana]